MSILWRCLGAFLMSFGQNQKNNQRKSLPVKGGFLLGWPTGIEPVIKAPQASVLPLHHGHHVCEAILHGKVPFGKYSEGLAVMGEVLAISAEPTEIADFV